MCSFIWCVLKNGRERSTICMKVFTCLCFVFLSFFYSTMCSDFKAGTTEETYRLLLFLRQKVQLMSSSLLYDRCFCLTEWNEVKVRAEHELREELTLTARAKQSFLDRLNIIWVNMHNWDAVPDSSISEWSLLQSVKSYQSRWPSSGGSCSRAGAGAAAGAHAASSPPPPPPPPSSRLRGSRQSGVISQLTKGGQSPPNLQSAGRLWSAKTSSGPEGSFQPLCSPSQSLRLLFHLNLLSRPSVHVSCHLHDNSQPISYNSVTTV